MIVARQKQYYQSVPGEEQKPEIRKRKPTREKRVVIRRRRALTRVCVILAIGILVISRFAVISEHTFRIRNMERELEELYRVNERLQLRHAQAMDVGRLEDYALHRLGMYYPDNREIVYVAVEGKEKTPLYAEEAREAQKAGVFDNRWFAFLTSRVSRILKGT